MIESLLDACQFVLEVQENRKTAIGWHHRSWK